MAPDSHFRRCVCAKPQCFDVQTALCNHAQKQPSGGGEGTTVDVWCQQPIQVNFEWATASFKSWLFILSLCHHLPEFKALFLSSALLPTNGKQMIVVNRIHFPRAILENRSTFKLKQQTALMKPADAKEIASLDTTDRIVEKVNTVDFLERFAKRILPTQMHKAFCKSRKDGFGSYFVQAPVGPLSEAMTHAKHLAKGKEDAVSLKRKAVLPLSYVMPASLKRQKPAYDHLGFVDAIAASSISSPLQSGSQGTPFLSPLKTYPGVDECRNTIKDRYLDRDTSTNFRGAITVLRNIHRNYRGILVSDANNPPNIHWIYPCSSCKSDCIGYALLSRRSRLPHSHCLECRAESRKEKINTWKRGKKTTAFSRQQAINSIHACCV